MQLELFLCFFFSFANPPLGEELFGFDEGRLRYGRPTLGLVGRTLLGGGSERENESHPQCEDSAHCARIRARAQTEDWRPNEHHGMNELTLAFPATAGPSYAEVVAAAAPAALLWILLCHSGSHTNGRGSGRPDRN